MRNGPNLQNIPIRTPEGRRIRAAFRNAGRSTSDPNAKCRDCDQLIPAGAGSTSSLDVGAMFFGKSAAVCPACSKRREDEKAMAERILVDAGYSIVHVPEGQDGRWLGGRWHVHKAGACYAAHSYRDGAVQGAYNDHVNPERATWATPGACEVMQGGDNA